MASNADPETAVKQEQHDSSKDTSSNQPEPGEQQQSSSSPNGVPDVQDHDMGEGFGDLKKISDNAVKKQKAVKKRKAASAGLNSSPAGSRSGSRAGSRSGSPAGSRSGSPAVSRSGSPTSGLLDSLIRNLPSQNISANKTIIGTINVRNSLRFVERYDANGKNIYRISEISVLKYPKYLLGANVEMAPVPLANESTRIFDEAFFLGFAAEGYENNPHDFLSKLDPYGGTFDRYRPLFILVAWKDGEVSWVKRKWWQDNYPGNRCAKIIQAKLSAVEEKIEKNVDAELDQVEKRYKKMIAGALLEREKHALREDIKRYELYKWALGYEEAYFKAKYPQDPFDPRIRRDVSPIHDDIEAYREKSLAPESFGFLPSRSSSPIGRRKPSPPSPRSSSPTPPSRTPSRHVSPNAQPSLFGGKVQPLAPAPAVSLEDRMTALEATMKNLVVAVNQLMVS